VRAMVDLEMRLAKKRCPPDPADCHYSNCRDTGRCSLTMLNQVSRERSDERSEPEGAGIDDRTRENMASIHRDFDASLAMLSSNPSFDEHITDQDRARQTDCIDVPPTTPEQSIR